MSKENDLDKSAVTPWATLAISIPISGPVWTAAARDAPTTREDLADATDRLESLGSMLAELDGVGGVETRDPSVLHARERAQLIVYTTPAELESLQFRATTLADALGLSVSYATEVRTDDDWRDSWKQYYQPMKFGDALTIRPSWIDAAADDAAPQLVLDPGRAFGTGLHESTRLCLDLIASMPIAPRSKVRVLDLGCGSGILGLAALRRIGAAGVATFVDIDPEATATASENAEINALSDRCSFFAGPIEDLVADAAFDLVFANIRPSVLVPGAAGILERVAAGGTLLLSGILVTEADEVAQAYAALGAAKPVRSVLNDWTALSYESRDR